MNKADTLKMFHKKTMDDMRPFLKRIFNVNGYSYATNDKAVCRTKGECGEDIENHPDPLILNWDGFENASYFEIAQSEIDYFRNKYPCHKCHPTGEGKLVKCFECNGTGLIVHINDYSHYECECITCGGRQYLPDQYPINTLICDNCNGTRIIPESYDDRFFYIYTDIAVDIQYVAIAAKIPNVKFCLIPSPDKRALPYAHQSDSVYFLGFKSPDFEGFIMPMRGDGY